MYSKCQPHLTDQLQNHAALIHHWVNMPNRSSPHVYISTHYYEMFQRDELLFKENRFKIEYLTFEHLFEDEITKEPVNASVLEKNYMNIYNKKIIFLYKIKKGLTR